MRKQELKGKKVHPERFIPTTVDGSRRVFVGLSPVGKHRRTRAKLSTRQELPMGQAGGYRKKVFVGLSGGVDSSVSAALLKQVGYDVTGVFIKVWQPEFIACTSREDRLDAMRVCAHLKIPFVTLDLEKEYKESVVDYMVAEYKRGHTPNPDVMCNKKVKFGAFLKYARKKGAEFVATGHYARKKQITNNKQQITRYELHAGVDKEKDQSYFLWTLRQEELKHILFPVGGLEKSQVRALAKEFGLVTALKKDSQGLCFVGKVDMKEFLKHFINEKKGIVVDEKGEAIGRHDGVALYTLGERRGFMITKKGNLDKPYYVVGKNLRRNQLIVSQDPSGQAAAGDIVEANMANLITGTLKNNKNYWARFRYRQKLQPCDIISARKNKLLIRLTRPDYTISPGQSLVIYEDSRVLGGGIISTVK